MKKEKDEVVKESDQEEGKDGITWRPMKMNHRAIHDRTDEHWSLRGL